MELGHLLTGSGLTYAEVSSKVYHDSFCQSDSSVSLPWVIYFEAFYLHVVSNVNKNPTDATVCRYLFTAKLLYMFRVSQPPSSGVLKTVPAVAGTGHTTCTATPLQRGLIRPIRQIRQIGVIFNSFALCAFVL